MCDLLWADPTPTMGRSPSKRGASMGFGENITKKFLQENKLSTIFLMKACLFALMRWSMKDMRWPMTASASPSSVHPTIVISVETVVPISDSTARTSSPNSFSSVQWYFSHYSAPPSSRPHGLCQSIPWHVLIVIIIKRGHPLSIIGQNAFHVSFDTLSAFLIWRISLWAWKLSLNPWPTGCLIGCYFSFNAWTTEHCFCCCSGSC